MPSAEHFPRNDPSIIKPALSLNLHSNIIHFVTSPHFRDSVERSNGTPMKKFRLGLYSIDLKFSPRLGIYVFVLDNPFVNF